MFVLPASSLRADTAPTADSSPVDPLQVLASSRGAEAPDSALPSLIRDETLDNVGAEEEVLLPLDDLSGVSKPSPSPGIGRESKKGKTQQTPQAPAPKLPPRVTVRKFHTLRWSPDANTLHSDGPVQIVYRDADGKATTLTANNLDYNATDQEVKATNGVRMERTEGSFTGQEIQYNFDSGAGYVTDAIAETDFFRMRGKRIQTEPNGTYVVLDGAFTTCVHGQPDYQIKAKRLAVSPNRYVSARNITFYAGKTPLIRLPSLRRNLRQTSQVNTPLPGYNLQQGLSLRFADSIAQTHQQFDYNVQLGLKRALAGTLAYQFDLAPTSSNALPPGGFLNNLSDPLRGFLEQLTPPTYRDYTQNRFDDYEPRTVFYSVLQSEQYVYNRRRTDLFIARYPEIGVRFLNILGHRRATPPETTPYAGGLPKRVPNAPFLLDVTASLGELNEKPTNLTSGRFALRTDVASQPLLVGTRLSLRVGATDWFNAYAEGSTYNLFSPEIALDYAPTRTSVFDIGYRYMVDQGTPYFASDRRDIRHELRLRYQVNGPWAFGVTTRYDLERSRAYDSEYVILRNLDCMQIGVSYRVRSQSFNIIFNLLPPAPNRARRRLMPLGTEGDSASLPPTNIETAGTQPPVSLKK